MVGREQKKIENEQNLLQIQINIYLFAEGCPQMEINFIIGTIN